MTSVQDVTECLPGICLYSSQFPCAASVFIFAAVSHFDVSLLRTGLTQTAVTIFLKDSFLSFTLAFLQQWPQMIVLSLRLGDTARGISRMWNLNTWSPQFMD